MTQAIFRLSWPRIAGIPRTVHGRLDDWSPGLLLTAVVGGVATMVSQHVHVSAMVFALVFGMMLNAFAQDERYRAGIQLTSTLLLRTGVALLGLRITISHRSCRGTRKRSATRASPSSR